MEKEKDKNPIDKNFTEENVNNNLEDEVNEESKEIDKEKEIDDQSENSEECSKNDLNEWEDKYKRLLAEFDNFRKRTEKEKSMMFDFGASNVLEKVLPIVDNIERALDNIPEDLKGNSFVEGVEKTYKQIEKTFSDLKVVKIKALNEKFDPNIHNAVMTDEETEAEVDTITKELQKGYMFKDQVLRHSMVAVKK